MHHALAIRSLLELQTLRGLAQQMVLRLFVRGAAAPTCAAIVYSKLGIYEPRSY